jgi:hypothetical protein
MNESRLAWRKSSYSGGHSTCVEVAPAHPAGGDAVMVRDNTDPGGPVLALAARHWQALIAGVKHGDYDTLG